MKCADKSTQLKGGSQIYRTDSHKASLREPEADHKNQVLLLQLYLLL